MTVLRSREILSPNKPRTDKTLETVYDKIDEPSTPSKPHERISNCSRSSTVKRRSGSVATGVTRRWSLRLASKSSSVYRSPMTLVSSGSRKRKDEPTPNNLAVDEEESEREETVEKIDGSKGFNEERELFDLGVAKVRGLELEGEIEGCGAVSVDELIHVNEEGVRKSDESGLKLELGFSERKSREMKGKRKLSVDIDINLPCFEFGEKEQGSPGFLGLRSGKKVAKRGMEGINIDTGRSSNVRDGLVDEVGEDSKDDEDDGKDQHMRRYSRKEKGKFLENDKSDEGEIDLELKLESSSVNVDENQRSISSQEREEISMAFLKLKGVAVEGSYGRKGKGIKATSSPNENDRVGSSSGSGSSPETKNLLDSMTGPSHLTGNVAQPEERHDWRQDRYIGRHRNIPRSTATEFARYNPQDEEENPLPATAEAEPEIEDWPGPFSTAMKIIKDREKKNSRTGNIPSTKSKPASVIWTPRKSEVCLQKKPFVPSLSELCLKILAKNADSIASLDTIPDALRHKLSQLLCDSRSMNSRFLELLLCGSPTEVRLQDCSWLTEEMFIKSLKDRDTSYLTVLQLNQCGRCMSDYVLPFTLARSSNSLPALTTLSLSGACRLTDAGLRTLLSSAPALRSINLNQCSFLTSSSIDILADFLGSSLRELYLNDCQNLDPMLILPGLKMLEQLEVLSLVGTQNIRDEFIQKLITVRGHNMKELVLTDCVKLTDVSLKVISEACPGLRSIDLVNLSKLTDAGLGYLANGCRAIQMLKLGRNAFSDEAVAAFLETSGEFLRELSLNNVRKVSHNTATSLAKRSTKLCFLDVSSCRNLTDEALGLIVDNCSSLRLLKVFGCTQITEVFLNGHSNPQVEIVGLKLSPVLKFIEGSGREEDLWRQ